MRRVKGMVVFHRIAARVSMCLCVLTLCSCVAPPSGLPTVERIEQEDVPVPNDFELRSSYAPDWKLAGDVEKARSWTGVYSGMTQVGEVAPWYVTEMQKHNWHFRGMQERAEHDRVLYFEKNHEASQIQIHRELDSRVGGFVTIVKAKVSPRGPEDLTVDENLRWREQQAGVHPVGFKPEAGAAASTPAPAIDRETPPATKQKPPRSPADPTDEIKEFEASSSH